MKSCGYYAMGQHLFALDQKHKNTTTQCNKEKNYEILWILWHGPTLVAERESNQVIKESLFSW